jgi:hypothetical protein
MAGEKTTGSAGTSADQRRHMRRLTLKTATISDGSGALDCAVLNISADGACLLVADAGLVPEVFELRIDGVPGCRSARRVWINAHRVGVHFVSATKSPIIAPRRPSRVS